MNDIKAIETIYNGYRFRSRLEARWAVFFDALGVEYEYEPEGFELPSGKRYLPDFKVKCYGKRGNRHDDLFLDIFPCLSCKNAKDSEPDIGDAAATWDYCDLFHWYELPDWVTLRRPPERTEIIACEKYEKRRPYFDLYIEVKGKMTRRDAEKIKEFAGEEIVKRDKSGNSYSWREIRNPTLIVGKIPSKGKEFEFDGMPMDGIDIYQFNYDLIDGDYFGAYPAAHDGKFYLMGDDSNYINNDDVPAVLEAYKKARQARFEYGDTPNI